MASFLGKPGGPGQFPTHDLSTVRGALQSGVKFGSRLTVIEWRDTEIAARSVGLTLRSVEVRAPEQLNSAFTAISREKPDALILLNESLTIGLRQQIGRFAVSNRLPMIAELREFAAEGALASYGASRPDLWRRSALYVDKIMRGANPGDLPVEQPTRFELVINL